MSELNDSQKKIATTLDGMIVVDAGPGTGKTSTIMERYINLLNAHPDPKDIILLTFTRNAASEMEDRIKSKLSESGRPDDAKDLRASTFDSFCFSIVMESPEAVSRFFGINEKLTRSARTVENNTLNRTYFSDFMDRFLADRGEDYGDQSIIASKHYSDLYGLIERLMARGIVPLKKGWFGGDDGDVLYGEPDRVLHILTRKNEPDSKGKSQLSKDLFYKFEGYSDPGCANQGNVPLSSEILESCAYQDRREMMSLIHDAYYEFIRHSIIDDRLTFGLVASFAYVVLYSDAKARERMRCSYLMIDEFQDTNSNQFMIALMLLKQPNLCVVGDWKQGIYGFRYVSIENITNFEKKAVELRRFLNDGEKRVPFEIPETLSLPLDKNYRSSQEIIDCAYDSLYIKGSSKEEIDTASLDRNIVKISSEKKYLSEHSEIRIASASSNEEEVLEVLRRIESYVHDTKYVVCEDENSTRQLTYGDIAVLCRTTRMARAINEAAIEAGIPVFLQGDVEIMGSREGKLLLAWLRYINNRSDRWGIGTILADQEYPLCEIEEMISNEPTMDVPEDITALRLDLIKKKRRITDLIATVFAYYGLNNDITQTITANISASHRGSLLTVSDIIRMIETDIRDKTTYNVDSFLSRKAVIIQTMHKSKGLEYPAVICAGFDNQNFPSYRPDSSVYRFTDTIGIRCTSEVVDLGEGNKVIKKSWKTKLALLSADPDYSEERRLLFVAISRAKQYVTILSGPKPSAFFKGLANMDMCVMDQCGTGVPHSDANVESESLIGRPAIDPFIKRRKNIGVHDILRFDGEDAPPEGSDQVCGKGMEYGTKVHKAAEALARNVPLDGEYSKFPEIPAIREVLESVKDAPIVESEIECALPFNDMNVTLRGIIDLYAEYPDRIEIHDYKTDVTENFESEYMLQLSVYAHAAEQATGKKAKCVIDYVSMGRRKEFDALPLSAIEERVRPFVQDR